jgi:hypothetical protein
VELVHVHAQIGQSLTLRIDSDVYNFCFVISYFYTLHIDQGINLYHYESCNNGRHLLRDKSNCHLVRK